MVLEGADCSLVVGFLPIFGLEKAIFEHFVIKILIGKKCLPKLWGLPRTIKSFLELQGYQITNRKENL